MDDDEGKEEDSCGRLVARAAGLRVACRELEAGWSAGRASYGDMGPELKASQYRVTEAEEVISLSLSLSLSFSFSFPLSLFPYYLISIV